MRKVLLMAVLALCWAGTADALERAYGFCTKGGVSVSVSGISGTPAVQASYPSCTVTVYLAGTSTLAPTLYSDNGITPLANPFTADANGYWYFYTADGRYDIVLSGAGFSTPFTLGDVFVGDGSSLSGAGFITPGGLGGFVTAPTAAPSLTLESSSGGTIGASTWYCVITYLNVLGETTKSPQASITTSGSTNQLLLRVADLAWITGAPAWRVFCGNTSGGPYFLQTPKTVNFAVANNGFTRASNVVTVTTSTNHGVTRFGQITIAGATGCGTAPNGTFTVTDIPSATSFTYAQTGGNESCGGSSATASYIPRLGSDNSWYVGNSQGTSDIILDTITLSGSQPPSTNTAAINPLQVAVNSGRDSSLNRTGTVLTPATTYTLTTPLILYNTEVRGIGTMFTDQACPSNASVITSNFTSTVFGTVMVMGPYVTLRNLCVTATNANALQVTSGSHNMNGLYLDGVFASSDSLESTTAPIRIHKVAIGQGWTFNNVTANGGRYVVYASNSNTAYWDWYTGRTNCSGAFNESSAFVNAAGPPDLSRGAKNVFDAVPSSISLTLYRHATESCKGVVWDWGGGFLSLRDGTQNADGVHPAGTEAILRLWSDNWSKGGSYTAIQCIGCVIFGSANVNATIKHRPGASDYGTNAANLLNGFIGGSTGSGSTVCVDANNISVDYSMLNTLETSGCSPDPNADASNGKFINVPTSMYVMAFNANGKDTATGVSRGWSNAVDRWRLQQGSDNTRARCFDIHDVSPFNFRFLAQDCNTVHGDWDTGGTFRFAGGVGARGVTTTFPATAAFYSATNGFGLEGRNAANTLDIRLLRPDSSDRAELCGTNCVSIITPAQFISTLGTGTAPFSVASTTVVPNLNVSQLLSKTWAVPDPIGATTPNTGAFTTLSVTGQFTSTLGTGTAPFSITSTTENPNLNADYWGGVQNTNAPSSGQVCVAASASACAWTTQSASGISNVSANVTIVTALTTTTSVQTLQTATIGANTATVGSQYQFTAKTEYTNGDSSLNKSANHQWGLDGAGLGSACQTASIAAGASAQAYLELHITILSTGAGGTAMIYTRCTPSTTSTDVSNMSATTVAFDTTAAHTISQRVNQTATTDASSTMIGRLLFGSKLN